MQKVQRAIRAPRQAGPVPELEVLKSPGNEYARMVAQLAGRSQA